MVQFPTAVVISVVVITCSAQPSREATKPQAFEVVSVKPNRSGTDSSHARSRPGRYYATNIKVKELIQDAFGVKEFQISGAPRWTETEGFDIDAITGTSSDLTDKEFEPILRALLTDKFQLRFHRETKQLPAYSLIVAKNGPKLRAHSGDAVFDVSIRRRPGKLILSGTKMSMSRLTEVLSRRIEHIVLDRTGLSGEYDLKMEWAPDPSGESADASIFTALQEQLGLKLESTRALVEIVVIDGVERLSEN
jgi:uncharacterized protein (TIGR03435 family)